MEKIFSKLAKLIWGPHLPKQKFEVPNRDAVSSLVGNASVIAGFSIAVIAVVLSHGLAAQSSLSFSRSVILIYLFLASMLLFKSCDCLNDALQFEERVPEHEEPYYRRQVYWGWRHYNFSIIIIAISLMFLIMGAVADAHCIPAHYKLAIYILLIGITFWWASFWFLDLWKTILYIRECEKENIQIRSPTQVAMRLSGLFVLILGLTVILVFLPHASWVPEWTPIGIALALLIMLRAIIVSTF